MSPRLTVYHFKSQSLDSQATQDLIDNGQFDTLVDKDKEKGGGFFLEDTFSIGKKGKAFVRAEQINFQSLVYDKNAIDPDWSSVTTNIRSLWNISVQSCSKNACGDEKAKAKKNAKSLGNWEILDDKVTVAKILVGDTNKDGLNDLLVQMSDGAGLLYTAVKPPKPKRAYDIKPEPAK